MDELISESTIEPNRHHALQSSTKTDPPPETPIQRAPHPLKPAPATSPSGPLTRVAADQRSRPGPKTPTGKAAVALNAVTSGAYAKACVLPGVERAEELEAHRAGMLESLKPVGYLQTWLAERVVEFSWKFQRIRRYEAAVLSLNQPAHEQEVTKSLEGRAKHAGFVGFSHLKALGEDKEPVGSGLASLEEDIELAKLQQAPLEQLAQAGTMLSSEVVAHWVDALIDDEGLDRHTLPEPVRKLRFSEDQHIPAAAVLEVAKTLSTLAGRTLPEMLGKAKAAGKAREATLRKLETWVATERQRLEPLQLLPRPDELKQLTRAEAHCWRLFERPLHELEALQARERGEATPLLRVDTNAPAEGLE